MKSTIRPFRRQLNSPKLLVTQQLKRKVEEEKKNKKSAKTFTKAANSYVSQGGERRYLKKICRYFKGREVTSINAVEIRQMALDLYPDCSNATKNRQGLTPARAVMYHAHELGWCRQMRIRSFKVSKSKRHKPVNDGWMHRFLEQCDKDDLPHLAACVLFMNHTAARVSEAVSLQTEHVDLRNRTALLRKTKTDVWVTKHLTDELMYRIQNLQPQSGKAVFKYTSRWSVNDRIKAVCRRAGIQYRSSHSVGRHSFATNALNMGLGVKTAMEAGHWKSSKVFLEIYAHTDDAGQSVVHAINKHWKRFSVD